MVSSAENIPEGGSILFNLRFRHSASRPSETEVKTKIPMGTALVSKGVDQRRKDTVLSGDVLAIVTLRVTLGEIDSLFELDTCVSVILSGISGFSEYSDDVIVISLAINRFVYNKTERVAKIAMVMTDEIPNVDLGEEALRFSDIEGLKY